MDKIIILDYGSQYTQLIARRIREQHVYSEIVPFDITAERAKAYAPKGIILSGGPNSGRARHRPRDLRPRRAGPRRLLRHAAHEPGAGRQGAARRAARIRQDRDDGRAGQRALQGPPRHVHRLDEPRRPRRGDPGGLPGEREARPDRLVEEDGRDGRIDATGEAQHDLVVADLSLQLLHRVLDPRRQLPVGVRAADVEDEVREDLVAVFGVDDLRRRSARRSARRSSTSSRTRRGGSNTAVSSGRARSTPTSSRVPTR